MIKFTIIYILSMNEIYESTSFVSLEWNINHVCNVCNEIKELIKNGVD